MGQTYLARPGAGHGNSWPRPEASGARPRSRALSLPSVRSPASHKPVGVGGLRKGSAERPCRPCRKALQPYCNWASTDPYTMDETPPSIL